MIISRIRDNLQEVRERLYLQLAFVVLGHPVKRLAARALKLTYCSIAMYGKGGGAKIYSRCKRVRVLCIPSLLTKRSIMIMSLQLLEIITSVRVVFTLS